MKIVEEGGIVQAIHNHGIRQCPSRIKAKNPDFVTQQRYYETARYFSIYYESNPTTMSNVSTILERQTIGEDVLRFVHVHATSKTDVLNLPDNVSPKTYTKNPYVKRVLQNIDDDMMSDEAVRSKTELTPTLTPVKNND